MNKCGSSGKSASDNKRPRKSITLEEKLEVRSTNVMNARLT
jgi:hypothetical protein